MELMEKYFFLKKFILRATLLLKRAISLVSSVQMETE